MSQRTYLFLFKLKKHNSILQKLDIFFSSLSCLSRPNILSRGRFLCIAFLVLILMLLIIFVLMILMFLVIFLVRRLIILIIIIFFLNILHSIIALKENEKESKNYHYGWVVKLDVYILYL